VRRQGAAAANARPVVIASANGHYDQAEHPDRASAVEIATMLLRDPEHVKRPFGLLEAAVYGVAAVEDDPLEHTVGLGGLPNEEGVVQLDASVMFGPLHKAGAVAALENIQNPALVAMNVLRYTDHSLLVGEGAYRFARAHGLPHVDLLTDEARRIWLDWRQSHSDKDDWIPPPESEREPKREQGTIHLSCVDANGDLAAVTTTSGLAFKIPGRVGDSPIVGAGMYVDNDVGAAGATGRGEEAIVNCAAFSMVEAMRSGLAPTDACLHVLQKVDANARRRGLVKDGKPTFDITFYALRKDGAFGSASMWKGKSFAVMDGSGARHEPCAWLHEA
jgi:N4-(beta-N-acetylglucosaminyl)-L-asparaginase